MSIAPYIKEIGRGKEGARSLDAPQAEHLMAEVLDGRASDLEIGAFCLAMRIKGETPDELSGFLQAAHRRCMTLPTVPAGGLVVLPSYNGARKLPNFTPLLAHALSQRGVAVLLHGPQTDPTRITSAQVLQAMGHAPAHCAEDIERDWQAGRPAYTPTESLCPALFKLLQIRWTLGLRNSGHTVAKLLCPFPPETPALRVINHTHPEYAISLSQWLAQSRTSALLMRGTEGEPVADCRRQPRFEVFVEGVRQDDLTRAPQDGVLTALPELPEGFAAARTADWTRDILAGRKALPAAIEAQVACLLQGLARVKALRA